jgi:hypothetical protein
MSDENQPFRLDDRATASFIPDNAAPLDVQMPNQWVLAVACLGWTSNTERDR